MSLCVCDYALIIARKIDDCINSFCLYVEEFYSLFRYNIKYVSPFLTVTLLNYLSSQV